MRTAPPLTVDIPRQTAWQVGAGLLVLAAAASLLVWALQTDPQARGPVFWLVTMLAVACLVAALGRVSAAPCRLHWDGRAWSAGDGAGRGGALVGGRLRVTLDLSVAMLLRFDGDPGSRPAARWIPVSRSGLAPAQWQALRRTVYSSPPHAGGSPGGDGPRTE